jgi:hypothetical protein
MLTAAVVPSVIIQYYHTLSKLCYLSMHAGQPIVQLPYLEP